MVHFKKFAIFTFKKTSRHHSTKTNLYTKSFRNAIYMPISYKNPAYLTEF